MALVLVTHNMGVVSETARRVAVMYAGQVVEERSAEQIFSAPQHPYTAALLSAMPERSTGDGRLATIPGVVPGLYDRPSGCLFAPRCSYATEISCRKRPAMREWKNGWVRCHFPLGDPNRDAAIARERLAEPTAVKS
jgi:dipeptide transport system ATP-binding protein